MTFEYLQVKVTFYSEGAAGRMADEIVTERLAACAQISGPVFSRFWWRGEVQHKTEWRAYFLTTSERYPGLESYVLSNYDGETPEVVTLPIMGGSAAYLSWISDETASSLA
jgi:periplasmic divalent cation tolerance protein